MNLSNGGRFVAAQSMLIARFLVITGLLAGVLAITIVSASTPAAAAPGDWIAFPSNSDTDGLFVDISGPAFSTPYGPGRWSIGIPSDATVVDIEIFDGDINVQNDPGSRIRFR